MKNESMFRHATLVAVFGVFLYAACLLWRFTMTDPAVMNHHLLSLKTAFPGFSGFDVVSIFIGGAWSFVYFFLGSIVFHSLHRNCSCGCSMK